MECQYLKTKHLCLTKFYLCAPAYSFRKPLSDRQRFKQWDSFCNFVDVIYLAHGILLKIGPGASHWDITQTVSMSMIILTDVAISKSKRMSRMVLGTVIAFTHHGQSNLHMSAFVSWFIYCHGRPLLAAGHGPHGDLYKCLVVRSQKNWNLFSIST